MESDAMPGTGPVVLIDFDGTIAEYRRWTGYEDIDAMPNPGAFDALRSYMDADFKVCVYSARSRRPGGVEGMRNWFKLHGLTEDEIHLLSFPTQKPAAYLTIDDRAWCFTGEWPTVADIYQFRPWHRRKKKEESDG